MPQSSALKLKWLGVLLLASIAPAGAPVSAVNKGQAQSWQPSHPVPQEPEILHLNAEETARARLLRDRWHGWIEPRISDLELLGIRARSERERRLYAERFVRRYRALTKAVLDFEAAVQKAHLRLFPDERLLDPALWYREGYVWTVRPGGKADRKDILERVMAAVASGHASRIRLLTQDRARALKWVREKLPKEGLRGPGLQIGMVSEGTEGLRRLSKDAEAH